MSDPLFDEELTGTTSTARHRAVRYRAGHESGDMFEPDVEYDGLTLTIEVSGRDDALAMIDAISGRADLSDALVAAACETLTAEAVSMADDDGERAYVEQRMKDATPADARAALEARDERIRREATEAERKRCHEIALDHRPDRPLASRSTAAAIAAASEGGQRDE